MAVLGIDAGASATKWSLSEDGKEVNFGVLPAMDAHLYRESSLVRFKENLSRLKNLTQDFNVERIVLGITGLSDINLLEEESKKLFDVPIRILSDIELAYRVNFNDKPGILLYAGTGSVCLSVNDENKIMKIGGWGYLLGDEGAGYWIGREAIRHTLFKLESNNPIESKSLEYEILRAMDSRDWDGIKQFVYSKERSEIAQLANIVSEYAMQGDRSASEISDNAGAHLVDLVNRMELLLGNKSYQVVFTGGISNSPKIVNYIKSELQNRFELGGANIAKLAAELV